MKAISSHKYKRLAAEHSIPQELISEHLKTIAMCKKSGVPPFLTLGHLAKSAGVSYRAATEFCTRKLWKHYRTFRIKKRSGGRRVIQIPVPQLKALQKAIHTLVLQTQECHNSVYAYVKTRSPKEMAERHLGARWLLKIDIEDFFGSITDVDVFRIFAGIGLPELLSFQIARICTVPKPKALVTNETIPLDLNYHGRSTLPQGAPSSPMLSNLVFSSVDEELEEIADRYGFEYTRYSDDICMSSSDRKCTREICVELMSSVRAVLAQNRFRINKDKTRILTPGSRKLVLGLQLNEDRVTLRKEFKADLQWDIQACRRFSVANHALHTKYRSHFAFIANLVGRATYAKMIDRKFGTACLVQIHQILLDQGYA